MSQLRTYQVCFFVGTHAPEHEGVQVIDVTPEEATVEAVHDAIAACGFSAADLRSRALFYTDADTHDLVVKALAVYSELIGLSRRCLDVALSDGNPALVMSDLSQAVSHIPTKRPSEVVPVVVVPQSGAVAALEDAVSVDLSEGLDPQSSSLISYAKQCVLEVSADPSVDFPKFIAIQGLRKRGDHERLPDLVGADGNLLSGESCRRFGDALRRAMRSDDRSHIAPRVDLTYRQQRLVDAAGRPVRETLVALGATSLTVERVSDDGEVTQHEVWKCLHPDNHTNGDANPSAKILTDAEGSQRFRCFRCLPEKVDALGLVMWALDCTGDEAADWIFAHVPAVDDADVVSPAAT